MARSTSTYESLCAYIGHIVLNWASAEQSLDICVTMVFHHFGGRALRKDLPRSLNRKTEFLGKAFRTIDVLKPISKSGIEIVDRMNSLSKKRHDMVHGALSVTHQIRGAWHFLKIDYGTDIHEARDVSYSSLDFQIAGSEMLALSGDVTLLASRLRKMIEHPRSSYR